MVGERLLPMFIGDPGNNMAGQQPEAGVLERDRALDQLTERLHDGIEALAIEGQVGELAVDLDRMPELRVLGVDDPFEDGRHDLEVGDILRDPDQGDAELVRLPKHVLRNLGQIALGLDDQTGRSDRRQIAHQVPLSRAVVFDGERHRQQ